VVGLGTQDSLGEAEDFVQSYSTTFTMLWDEGFDSWIHFGINGQPAGILASSAGELIGQWSGGIPEDAVLSAVAEL
jgi:hypothetical protein